MCGSYSGGASAPSSSLAPAAVPPSTPAPAAAGGFPVGEVDFNKPLRTSDDHDKVTVVTVLPAGGYPILVQVEGDEKVYQVDKDGGEYNGEIGVENVPEEPAGVRFFSLFRDGDKILASEESFDSASDASNDEIHGLELVGIASVDLTAAKELLASTKATPTSDAGTNDPAVSVLVGGRYYRAGDTARFYRRGFGTRTGTVVKVDPTDSRKSLFVQANDGSNAYWALNKNIQN